jgi:hypothetical protein
MLLFFDGELLETRPLATAKLRLSARVHVHDGPVLRRTRQWILLGCLGLARCGRGRLGTSDFAALAILDLCLELHGILLDDSVLILKGVVGYRR